MYSHSSLLAGSVVGTITSWKDLERARAWSGEGIHYFELRLDAFAGSEEKLRTAARDLAQPLIITARHHREGGLTEWTEAERAAVLGEFLPLARFADVEIAQFAQMDAFLKMASQAGVPIIASHHNFVEATPIDELRALAQSAADDGAMIFKAAVHLARVSDLVSLASFMTEPDLIPRSLMGMGPYGKVSRLLLAQAGSVLNYASMGEAQVPGQWTASTFASRVAEILPTTA